MYFSQRDRNPEGGTRSSMMGSKHHIREDSPYRHLQIPPFLPPSSLPPWFLQRRGQHRQQGRQQQMLLGWQDIP